jgi:hypothetical protein
MPNIEKFASFDDLLIAQVTGLIRAAAEEAAQMDPLRTVEYKAHFHKLIGTDCIAKAGMFEAAVEEFRTRHQNKRL